MPVETPLNQNEPQTEHEQRRRERARRGEGKRPDLKVRMPLYERIAHDPDPWFTVDEAARLSGFHHATLRPAMKAKRLRFAAVGSSLRLRRSRPDAWIENAA